MSDKDEKKVIIKFVAHHIVMMIMAVIMVFAVWYAYNALQDRGVENVEMPASSKTSGIAKPLPDFIVDKIKPDELGELKL